MIISSILAVDRDMNIGYNNDLIYHSKKDLQRFKSVTENKTIIIGRKTFESLPIILPNRNVIIVSTTLKSDDFPVRHYVQPSLSAAIAFGSRIEEREILIAGGRSLYMESLDICDKIYLTVFGFDFNSWESEKSDIDLYGGEWVNIAEWSDLLNLGDDEWNIEQVSSYDDVRLVPINKTKYLPVFFLTFDR